jgi:RNA polymerase sigma-70 factor (ECF subfamily)
VAAAGGEITLLLDQLRQGNRDAESQLMPLVYQELRQLARGYLRAERADHTLQATALVHEAYLRLVGQNDAGWKNRAHFFGIAAQMMRRVLVDHARAHRAGKRGGTDRRTLLDSALAAANNQSAEMMALDEALDRLAALDPRQCRIVELKFFAGLSEEETAEVLGISTRTVKRDWAVARAWLFNQLAAGAGAAG